MVPLVIIVRGTDITSEIYSGAHISRGNTYHCNTGTVMIELTVSIYESEPEEESKLDVSRPGTLTSL